MPTIGIVLASLCFYEAIRIQVQKGIIKESKIAFLFTLALSFLQFFITPFPVQDMTLFFVFIIGIVILLLFIKIYFQGKSITVYATTKNELLRTLRGELSDLSIPYKEEDSLTAEATLLELYEDRALIKISSFNSEGTSNYTVSFKKWWRVYQIDEVQLRMIEVYQKEREQQIFWKPILLNCLLGIGILFVTFYLM